MMHCFKRILLITCLVFNPLLSEERQQVQAQSETATPNPGSTQDWRQWRGANRNGRIVSDRKFTSQTLIQDLWSAEVGIGFSGSVIAENRLVTLGSRADQDVVSCLNATTGEKNWEYLYPAPLDPNLFEGGPTATPAIDAGKVYTLSRQGLVHCFELELGRLIWSFDIVDKLKFNVPTWGFSGSPLIREERCYLNVGSHGICLNSATGELVWASTNDVDAGYSSPFPVTLGETTHIISLNAKSLNGVNAQTGELLWSERWITRYGINAADPLLIGEQQLIVSSGYGKGTALVEFTENSATLHWRQRDIRTQMSPGVLVDGAAYAIDGDEGDEPRLVCFDPHSGEVHWSADTFGAGTLIALNSQILALRQGGELQVFNSNSQRFDLILKHQLTQGKCWTPLSVVGDRIYSRNASGKTTCSLVQ